MLLSVTMIGCNYTNAQWVVMLLMSLAFFGKGFGALGWTGDRGHVAQNR